MARRGEVEDVITSSSLSYSLLLSALLSFLGLFLPPQFRLGLAPAAENLRSNNKRSFTAILSSLCNPHPPTADVHSM